MVKKTIKPKTVKVIKNTETRIVSTYEYACPSCFTTFRDYTLNLERVTRFKCSCGQELIVDMYDPSLMHYEYCEVHGSYSVPNNTVSPKCAYCVESLPSKELLDMVEECPDKVMPNSWWVKTFLNKP